MHFKLSIVLSFLCAVEVRCVPRSNLGDDSTNACRAAEPALQASENEVTQDDVSLSLLQRHLAVSRVTASQIGANEGSQRIGLQKWAIGTHDDLGFIHVGKCGGTSFDDWLTHHAAGRDVTGGHIHADMSYMNHYSEHRTPHVLSFLREPGDRAASNILFWQTLPFSKPWPSRNWTLSEMIQEGQLGNYSGAFGDGFGGVCWLAGVCPNGWYINTYPNGKNQTEHERRHELMQRHPSEVLALAKAGLESLAWFGLHEHVDRSMELLKWQLGLDKDVEGLPHENVNPNHVKSSVAEEDLQDLRERIPLDMALYTHAQALFEKRWLAYQHALAKGQAAEDAGFMPGPDNSSSLPIADLTKQQLFEVKSLSYSIPFDFASE